MINKIAVITLCIFFSINNSFGQEIDNLYDGIWMIEEPFSQGDFHLIRQNGETLIIANLDAQMDGWNALYGPIQGNKAELQTLVDPEGLTLTASVEFTSAITGTLVIKSCLDCDFPVNVPIPVKKIF